MTGSISSSIQLFLVIDGYLVLAAEPIYETSDQVPLAYSLEIVFTKHIVSQEEAVSSDRQNHEGAEYIGLVEVFATQTHVLSSEVFGIEYHTLEYCRKGSSEQLSGHIESIEIGGITQLGIPMELNFGCLNGQIQRESSYYILSETGLLVLVSFTGVYTYMRAEQWMAILDGQTSVGGGGQLEMMGGKFLYEPILPVVLHYVSQIWSGVLSEVKVELILCQFYISILGVEIVHSAGLVIYIGGEAELQYHIILLQNSSLEVHIYPGYPEVGGGVAQVMVVTKVRLTTHANTCN